MGKSKKADIAVNTIFFIFIAIVSITLLLALFGTKLPGFGKTIYCKTVFHLHKSAFFPKGMRADQDYCKQNLGLKVQEIRKKTAHETMFANNTNVLIVTTSPASIRINLTNSTIINVTMNITAYQESEINLDVWDDGSDEISNLHLSSSSSQRIDITEPVTSEYGQYCRATGYPCTVPIRITTLSPPPPATFKYALHDLDIKHEKCFYMKEIVARMLACWEQVNFGSYSQDVVCSELFINKECQEETLTEEELSEFLHDKELCDLIAAGPSCSNDNVEWGINDALTLYPEKNVLVEFKAEKKSIKVS